MKPSEKIEGVLGSYQVLDTSPTANAVQVDGDHYKKYPIQPWDFIAANGLDYFQGNIVSYVTRFRDKGGIRDLEKAKHYLQKLIELEQERAKFENKRQGQDQ